MSAAGREMKLSPAVVSKRISLLEDRLGVRLFQRTTRQLALTETGEGFFKRVVDILNLVEEAEDFVNRRNKEPTELLRITAPPRFSKQHIAPHLPEFSERYPEIELDFKVNDEIVDIVGEGYDLAIRIAELKDSSLVARKLAPNPRVLCASPAYVEKFGEPKTIEELAQHNCIVTTAMDQWRLEGPDGARTLRVKGNVGTNSSEFLHALLMSGHGIAFRSLWSVSKDLNSGKLKKMLPEYMGASNISVYAVYPSRDFMPQKVNVFIDYFAEVFDRKLDRDNVLRVA